jgi:hypothetical protein
MTVKCRSAIARINRRLKELHVSKSEVFHHRISGAYNSEGFRIRQGKGYILVTWEQGSSAYGGAAYLAKAERRERYLAVIQNAVKELGYEMENGKIICES